MEVFALTKENVRSFYPLLPEDSRAADPDAGIVLLGAAEENEAGEMQACGTLVMQMADEDTWLLSWILVAPAFRDRGIGGALLELGCTIAEQMDMQLYCLFSKPPEESDALYSLLRAQNFTINEREARSYSITLEHLGEEAFFKRSGGSSNDIVTLNEVDKRALAQFNKTLAEQGHLLVEPISSSWALGDASVVCMEDGKITACLLFDRFGSDGVRVSFAYSMNKASMKMPMLLLRAYSLLRERFAPETELVIPCVTETSVNLVEKLIPSAATALVSYSAQRKPLWAITE